MLYIEYCKTGHAINDFELDDEISWIQSHICEEQKRITNNRDEFLYYSTENIFNRVRLEIVMGNISENNIIFRYDGVDVIINRFGAIVDRPNGFCDVNINMAEQIMRFAMKKRKSETE